MSKAKLTLTANPTFKARVAIPVPGAASVPVEFTFRHRDQTEYNEWVSELVGKDEVDLVLDIASGWDLEDPFGRDTVEQLLSNYMGSGKAIFTRYIDENTGAKAGN